MCEKMSENRRLQGRGDFLDSHCTNLHDCSIEQCSMATFV